MNENQIQKAIIALSDMTVKAPTIDRNSRDYVRFGNNNLFPNELLKLAKESPLQSAILNNQFIYAMGAGFEEWTDDIFTPNLFYNWEELTRRCMRDYVYLQAFSVQLMLNEDGKTYSFFHQPVDQVRLGNYNSLNVIEDAYLNTNWQNASPNNIVKIKMFGSEIPVKGEKYLLYYKDYNLDELYYPTPYWYSAGNWILADILLSKYYCNTVGNGFTPSTAILYPNEPDNDKKEAIYDALINNFGGTENAGSIMLLFGENDVLPDIKALNASTNPDLYKDFSAEVLSKIISANRLPSPTLAGISSTSTLGGQNDEIIAAYSLYKLTVIYGLRSFVLTKINGLLKMNGYKPVLNIIDFDLKAEIEGNIEKNEDIAKETLDVDSGDETEQKKEEAEETIEEEKYDEIIDDESVVD